MFGSPMEWFWEKLRGNNWEPCFFATELWVGWDNDRWFRSMIPNDYDYSDFRTSGEYGLATNLLFNNSQFKHPEVLLMQEIHRNPASPLMVEACWNPINDGINVDRPPFSTGAGFRWPIRTRIMGNWLMGLCINANINLASWFIAICYIII